MAHVNTVTVQTAEGATEVTKISTHRDYEVATVVTLSDGTEKVCSWHLLRANGQKFVASAEGQRILTRYGIGSTLSLRPVTVTLTGKDRPAVSPEGKDPRTMTADEKAVADAKLSAPKASKTPATSGQCRCGCGLPTASTYRPGHDARHAAAVARDIASSSVSYFERVTADDDLGSEALVEKAHRQAEKLIAKMQKASAKAAK